MKNNLVRDFSGSKLQGFVPDPAKCLGVKTANTVFKVGEGGDIDISNWLVVEFEPTEDGTIVFNGDSAKIRKITGGAKNEVIIHPSVTQLVPSVSCVVCGM